jgi:hypothetical protein
VTAAGTGTRAAVSLNASTEETAAGTAAAAGATHGASPPGIAHTAAAAAAEVMEATGAWKPSRLTGLAGPCRELPLERRRIVRGVAPGLGAAALTGELCPGQQLGPQTADDKLLTLLLPVQMSS